MEMEIEKIENNGEIIIPDLTQEEIETLQVDAALRLIGSNTVLLNRLSRLIGKQIVISGKERIKLEELKQQKLTIIELQRSLKVIAERA